MIPQVARSIAMLYFRVMKSDWQEALMPSRTMMIAGLALVAFAALALAACTSDEEPPPRSPLGAAPTATPTASASPAPAAGTATASPTPPPSSEGAPSPEVLEALVGNALELMAEWLGWDVTGFGVVESEALVWPDGCLGVAVPGTLCTQALVPGFRAVLHDKYEGVHRVHGDAEGRVVRWVGERIITGTVADATRHYLDIATADGVMRVNAAPGSRYGGPGLSPGANDLVPVAEAIGGSEVAVGIDPAADGSGAYVIAWLVVLE